MARRRSTRRTVRNMVIFVVVATAAGWWGWSRWGPARRPSRPVAARSADAPAEPAQRSAAVATVGGPAQPGRPSPKQLARARKRLADAQRALKRGDLVTARTAFNDALGAGLPADQQEQVRAELARLADQTIFSARHIPGDPLTGLLVVKPGQTLRAIGKQFKVSDDLLAMINRIADKSHIRAGQTIKVVHGPFHAIVDKSQHRMYVYLQNLLVRTFPVGLGIEGSTPSGEWQVKDKLVNPAYYPPRGGKIIPADDPSNPLGERWIGLKGLGGQAKGQLRYGIHGTIEPDSIGKDVSLGCIRLHNPDVELLFKLLVLKDSRVTVRD